MGDLEGALDALGIEIWKTTDDEVTCRCPKHLERTGREDGDPSWSVNRDTGLHNCWSCGFKGRFVDLVMAMRFKNDMFAALRWMREFGIGNTAAELITDWREKKTEREVEYELVPETRLAMFEEVPDWALEKRVISRESAELYGLRWNPKHDAWIIPIRRPETTELVGWQEKWEGKRRFINDPRNMSKSECLFGLDVFPVGEPAMLVESPLDVAHFHTMGWEGGLASMGSHVSHRQMEIICEVAPELVVALDDDEAGQQMAEELRIGAYERGKLITPRWSGRIPMRFFYYGNTGMKDIGDMEQSDIARGLDLAVHSTIARLGTPEQEKQYALYRDAQAVPAGARRANGRPGTVPVDRGRGNRKNADDDRSLRGATRRVR